MIRLKLLTTSGGVRCGWMCAVVNAETGEEIAKVRSAKITMGSTDVARLVVEVIDFDVEVVTADELQKRFPSRQYKDAYLA